MPFCSFSHFRRTVALICLLLFIVATPSFALLEGLLGGGDEKVNEEERQQTIERIESIQQKLKLLQEKLRVMERRKTASDTDQSADTAPGAPLQTNWVAVDEETTQLDESGLYTYLLFNGELSDADAIGALEDFILTVETLSPNDISPALANRFLVPVEKAQSSVNLGRRPYDFDLNRTYLKRFGLHQQPLLATGPILVSLRDPVDPYGEDAPPQHMVVNFGHLEPQRTLELAKLWHTQKKSTLDSDGHAVAALLWQLLDGAGPTQVTRVQQQLLVELTQP
ncbi:MAG: hypothetical protein OET90_04735 [Desulfuromonadales bacterium]|nr:hypothetical protein [Desulfuromonadales bacterium]